MEPTSVPFVSGPGPVAATWTCAEHLEGGSGGTRPPVRSAASTSSGGAGVSPADLLLDPFRTIQTTPCTRPVGESVSSATGKRYQLPCKRWDCEECGPRRVWDLRKRYELGDLIPTAFLTLTQQTDDDTPIMAAWNRFVSALRKNGWHIRYFWTREFTRAGKNHLHVLVEGWWDWTETSRYWMLATGGRSKITNIKRVRDPRQAVVYITKYMTKGLTGLLEPGQRRYGNSRGVVLPMPRAASSHHVYIYAAGCGYVGVGDNRRRIEGYNTWLKAVEREIIKALGLKKSAFEQTQQLITS